MKAISFALLFSLSTAAACVSRFDAAMDAGRALAASADWDAAAAEFERAHQLDPDDTEAWDLLMEARRNQARVRVAASKVAMHEQRFVDAYRLAREARAHDPGSTDAQEVERASRALLVGAIQTRLDGRPREALVLARELLRYDPEAADAKALFADARDRTAAAATARGEALERSGQQAAAWLSYAEAVNLLGASAPAKPRMDAVQGSLVDASTFYVLMGTFNGDPSARDLGAQVGPADFGRGLDPSLLLVVTSTPLPDATKDRFRGVRLGGAFQNYAFNRSLRRENAACDYVCGYDTVANPQRPGAEDGVRAARRDATRAEGQLARTQREFRVVEERRIAAEREVETARFAARTAEDRLATCKRDPQAQCQQEQLAADFARTAQRRAEDEQANAASAASLARSALDGADNAVRRARDELDAAQRRLDGTPAFVDVPRTCTFNYEKRFAAEEASVELALQGEGLYDTTLVLDETVRGRQRAEDLGYDAAPGRCAEVAEGDPLRLPGEPALRANALESAIAGARKVILKSYEAYRTDLANEQRRAETAADAASALRAAVGRALTSRSQNEAGALVGDLARLADVPTDAVTFALASAFAGRGAPAQSK